MTTKKLWRELKAARAKQRRGNLGRRYSRHPVPVFYRHQNDIVNSFAIIENIVVAIALVLTGRQVFKRYFADSAVAHTNT